MTRFHLAWMLALCDSTQRSQVRKWIRERAATARYRERNADACRARVRAHKRHMVETGYLRKGGAGFRPQPNRTAKRRAYMANYHRAHRGSP